MSFGRDLVVGSGMLCIAFAIAHHHDEPVQHTRIEPPLEPVPVTVTMTPPTVTVTKEPSYTPVPSYAPFPSYTPAPTKTVEPTPDAKRYNPFYGMNLI